MREEKVGLLIPHFSFQRFNHTGGLAFHQGVKCLIFLLVSFFFLHNECKSKNVNKAFPHHTHALRPPPASYACSDLRASFLRTLRPSFASYRFCRSAAPCALPRASAGARVSGRRQHRKPSGPAAFTSEAAITSTSAITSATLTSAPNRAAGSKWTQLSRPLQGAAQRPRFLCTLERVINLE